MNSKPSRGPGCVGKELRRPVHRSDFTAAHLLDGETRFNPDGYELYDRHGKQLNHFDSEPVSEDRTGD